MGSTVYLARCAMGEPNKADSPYLGKFDSVPEYSRRLVADNGRDRETFGEGLKIPLNEYPLPLLAVTKEQADELERLSKKWSPQDDAVLKEGLVPSDEPAKEGAD